MQTKQVFNSNLQQHNKYLHYASSSVCMLFQHIHSRDC